MPSDYTGDGATYTDTLPLPVDSDAPSAQLFRVPYERLLDNDSTLKARLDPIETRAALHLRLQDTGGGGPPSDLSNSLGAVSNSLDQTVILKGGTDGLYFAFGCDLLLSATGTANLSADVRKIAKGARLLAVGDGGTDNAFSTNNGATWTSGGSTGLIAAPTDVVWNGTRFIASTDSGGSVNSTNGVAWTAAGVGTDISDILTGGHGNGLAAFSGGRVVAAGIITNPAFATTVNVGVTWTNTGGTIPSAASFAAGRGYLAGNGGEEIYWLGNDGTSLKCFASADGITWTLRGEVTSLVLSGASSPKLLMCQDTGMLVAICAQSFGGIAVAVSTNLGATWSPHINTPFGSIHAFGVANGRLFATDNEKIFASDGLQRTS